MRFIFLGLIILIGSGSHAQTVKSSFQLNELNGEVLISITIYSGNICNGIEIWRSSDSVSFEVVGTIAGYCGSVSETLNYSFVDENPITNQKSYYKLSLVGLDDTEAKSILVLDFEKENYKITSNPVTSKGFIYFKNTPNSEFTLNLIGLNGQRAYTFAGQGNSFEIEASQYENGTYIFLIENQKGDRLASGKLVILNL